MNLWHELTTLLPCPADEARLADDLRQRYIADGYLDLTPTALLQLPDAVICRFYAGLAEARSAASPVRHCLDSSWMLDSDFCFINIRATGQGEAFGNCLTAAKLLPGIRANALHLGPFTGYDLGVIYAVTSVQSVSHKIIHPGLDALGFDGERQLQALVAAAHLLGKTVGFDLEPHTAQFAITVLEHPELFRWIKLNADRSGLIDGLSNEAMQSDSQQARLIDEVRALHAQALARAGLTTFEQESGDTIARLQQKESLYFQLIGELIHHGLWTLPSQAWNAQGLPAFAHYHHQNGHPCFDYRAADGSDAQANAYHILSPFKFYRDLPTNRAPEQRPSAVSAAITFFAQIFAHWRDRFDFDFVRYDSVDHIVDSIVQENGDFPAADRPTPAVLAAAIAASKSADKPWIGNLAERMGCEIDAYAAMGFDLMLGNDMMQRVDAGLIGQCFRLHDALCQRVAHGLPPFAITFAIDTHDTGNAGLWGRPLIELMGFERMRLRHFVARFLGCGAGRRPKYEVMGLADLSYGLYAANVSDCNLHWQDNRAFNHHYHLLENHYQQLQPTLQHGQLLARHCDERVAWWLLAGEGRVLLAVIALETADAAPVGHVAVAHPALHGELSEFDFSNGQRQRYGAVNGLVEVWNLPHLHFRLFAVETPR